MVNFQKKEHYNVEDLRRLMALLRQPDGCPWDRAQTHASIRANLLEEAYEAADAIDRIVGVFSQEDQQQIRMQLSMTLQAVLAQQLLPSADHTRRLAACELMMVTPAVRNLIREGKTPQLNNAIATSGAEGSITMDAALLRLLKAGKITAQAAEEASRDPDQFRKNRASQGWC